MRIATMKSLVSFLNGEAVENIAEIKAELEAELNKGAVAKAEKAASYDAAWDAVCEVFAQTTAPLTVAEIFEAVEANLPDGFTKGKVQYALLHYWEAEVVKTENGKNPNTYALKSAE